VGAGVPLLSSLQIRNACTTKWGASCRPLTYHFLHVNLPKRGSRHAKETRWLSFGNPQGPRYSEPRRCVVDEQETGDIMHIILPLFLGRTDLPEPTRTHRTHPIPHQPVHHPTTLSLSLSLSLSLASIWHMAQRLFRFPSCGFFCHGSSCFFFARVCGGQALPRHHLRP